MEKPIAQFGISNSGLTVNFINTSLNDPTSYLWDFGDGSTSKLENPSHTFNEMGFFTVTLIAYNDIGPSEPISMRVIVGKDIINSFDKTILELVGYYSPDGVGKLNIPLKETLIKKWQMYLQPLVFTPYPVEPEDTFFENRWPALVNNLIAQLVSYDIMLLGAAKFLESIGDGAYDEDGDPMKGAIKSIETGPAKTEWFDNHLLDIEKIGKAFGEASKPGGLFFQIKESACQLAKRLGIYLPMCGTLSSPVIAPSVVSKKRKALHNANPFGITKRMT